MTVVHPRRLATRGLVGALYFMVAGGPYGLEELLAKVGPWGAIAILLITPLVWSLPTALMVGELGAAIPEEGGYYVWVKRALGPFFGFQEAWLSLAASIFDMAIYPSIFVSYIARFWPVLGEAPWSIALGVGLIAICALANLLGSKSVGDGSAVMTVVLLLPFAVLTVLLFGQGGGGTIAPRAEPIGSSDLLGGVLVAMWNYMGWDNASTIAGEVSAPQTTYPRAVILAVALVTITYVIPAFAVAVAGIDVSAWETGAWVDLGASAGGTLLRGAMIAGGMLCGFGMLNALVLSYSRIPVALAEDGYLPIAFARRSKKNDAPVLAIAACAVAWTLSLGLKFDRLVALDILLYGLSLALEFVALVVLRVKEPNLPRPYRVPGGLPGAVILGIPPLILLGVAGVKNSSEQAFGMNALVFGILVVLLGAILFFIARAAFRRPAIENGGTRAP